MYFGDLPNETLGHILDYIEEDEYAPTRYVERRWRTHRRQCTLEFIRSAYLKDILENELVDSIVYRREPVFVVKTTLGDIKYEQGDDYGRTSDYEVLLRVFFPDDLSVVTLTQKSEIYFSHDPVSTSVSSEITPTNLKKTSVSSIREGVRLIIPKIKTHGDGRQRYLFDPYTMADIVGRRLKQCDSQRVDPTYFGITVGRERRVALYFYYLGLEALVDNVDLYSIDLLDIERTVVSANPSFIQVEGNPIDTVYTDTNPSGYLWSYGTGGLQKMAIDNFIGDLLATFYYGTR